MRGVGGGYRYVMLLYVPVGEGWRIGDRMAKEKILAVTWWGWGGGAVQNVQEHNLHQF